MQKIYRLRPPRHFASFPCALRSVPCAMIHVMFEGVYFAVSIYHIVSALSALPSETSMSIYHAAAPDLSLVYVVIPHALCETSAALVCRPSIMFTLLLFIRCRLGCTRLSMQGVGGHRAPRILAMKVRPPPTPSAPTG